MRQPLEDLAVPFRRGAQPFLESLVLPACLDVLGDRVPYRPLDRDLVDRRDCRQLVCKRCWEPQPLRVEDGVPPYSSV